MPRLNCCKGNESPTDLDRGKIIMRDANLPVIWVFGGRCSGKTSLSERIGDKYQLQHIDCDNVLRFEALRQSARGVDIMARLNRHERLPHDILIKLLREIMPRHVKVTKGYILDNFPTNLDQGVLFEEKICKVAAVFYLKATTKTMLKRFKRRENESRDAKPPSLSGAELFFRPVAVHDVVLQPERIDIQVNDFQAVTPSVTEHYSKILHVIDAEKLEDEMFREADKYIKQLCATYDIPDRGNVNAILIKNFLVDKSALPKEEPVALHDDSATDIRTLPSMLATRSMKIGKEEGEEEKISLQERKSLKVTEFTTNDEPIVESFRDALRPDSDDRTTTADTLRQPSATSYSAEKGLRPKKVSHRRTPSTHMKPGDATTAQAAIRPSSDETLTKRLSKLFTRNSDMRRSIGEKDGPKKSIDAGGVPGVMIDHASPGPTRTRRGSSTPKGSGTRSKSKVQIQTHPEKKTEK